MNERRFLRGLKILGIVVAACIGFGFVIMHLWNWLMPGIFGLRPVTFFEALGLLVLGKILFGGFHRHGGCRRGWRQHMEERWAKMSPEERERFRAGMGGRRECGFAGPREPVSEQRPV